MTSLKVFGLITLLMVAGTIMIPALAQQTQNQTQTMDCDGTCDGVPDQTQDQLRKRVRDCSCDGTCDGTPDRTQTQQQKRPMDCSCDGTQARDGIMKQDRDRVCKVGDFLRTQQQDQLKTKSC